MMDFLRFLFTKANLYEPVVPLLAAALSHTRCSTVVDLCSGAGGTVEILYKQMHAAGLLQKIILTDKFPNMAAYRQLQQASKGFIQYAACPVDAMQVPATLPGFRTLFSGFHHFSTAGALAVLRNAVDAGEGIAIFDGGDKNLKFILSIIFLQPVAFLLFTPFIRPFRWWRLLFTYLLPVIPLCTMWDGVVSALRLYKPEQMLQLARQADNSTYKWQVGIVKNKWGLKIAYLVGYPAPQG